MNICCGEATDGKNLVIRREEKGELIDYKINYEDKIYLTLEQKKLRFYENPGVFDLDKIEPSGNQKKIYDELKSKIIEKEEKIDIYKKKIKDLDLKLANMEKVLLMDDKEQQYIKLIGQYHNQ